MAQVRSIIVTTQQPRPETDTKPQKSRNLRAVVQRRKVLGALINEYHRAA